MPIKTMFLIIAAAFLTACGGGDPAFEQATMMAKAAAAEQPPELLANADMQAFTTQLAYVVPGSWACKNYPRIAKACMYQPGSLELVSAPMGSTVTARLAWPIAPSWSQSFMVPADGTYTLAVTVSKREWNANSIERPTQAVVIKDGLTTLATIQHTDIPLGGETTLTVPVTLAAGPHTLFLSLATRTGYGTFGNVYGFRQVSIR